MLELMFILRATAYKTAMAMMEDEEVSGDLEKGRGHGKSRCQVLSMRNLHMCGL